MLKLIEPRAGRAAVAAALALLLAASTACGTRVNQSPANVPGTEASRADTTGPAHGLGSDQFLMADGQYGVAGRATTNVPDGQRVCAPVGTPCLEP